MVILTIFLVIQLFLQCSSAQNIIYIDVKLPNKKRVSLPLVAAHNSIITKLQHFQKDRVQSLQEALYNVNKSIGLNYTLLSNTYSCIEQRIVF